MGQEASTEELSRLVRPLKNTKGHDLECDCYRELFHVSDEVIWAMRQATWLWFLHYRSPVKVRLTK